MRIKGRYSQVSSIIKSSKTSIPLILDLMRVKRSAYTADCKGLKFELKARCHEWYTLYENVVREDYFKHGITVAPGDTVIDVGANFGSFTMLAARKVGPMGKIISFEPNPDVYDRLKRNVSLNFFSNISLRNEAVSGEDGEIDLLIQSRSSLTTAFSDIKHQYAIECARPVRVKATGINSILRSVESSVSLLKIDCEGAEYDIFDALDCEALSKVQQITMELHAVGGRSKTEIADKLRKSGFFVHNAYPMLTAVRKTL